jgi:DNA-binding winged helix-turn-helix (wHTH) protein
LLTALVGAPGRVFSRDELVAIIWPDEDPAGVSEEALNSLVRRLRRRLTDVDPNHRYIYAVRGHGFKHEPPPGDDR